MTETLILIAIPIMFYVVAKQAIRTAAGKNQARYARWSAVFDLVWGVAVLLGLVYVGVRMTTGG